MSALHDEIDREFVDSDIVVEIGPDGFATRVLVDGVPVPGKLIRGSVGSFKQDAGAGLQLAIYGTVRLVDLPSARPVGRGIRGTDGLPG